MDKLTAEERQEMLHLKRFLSKNPYGGLLSDEQVLVIIRDADELVKIPSFVDEGLRKEKAQSTVGSRKAETSIETREDDN